MNLIVVALLSLSHAAGGAAVDSAAGDAGFTPLFNGRDFSGFYTYLSRSKRTTTPIISSKSKTG